MRGHFCHDLAPRARDHSWIMRREICAGEGEIQSRLPLRFVHRVEQCLRLASIARSKRSLPLGIIRLPVESAVPPAIQSVLLLHVFLHVEENARAKILPLRSTRGVLTELARIVSANSICWQFRWHLVSETVLLSGEPLRCEAITIWLQR